ncbi:hypothetical protein BDW75DRAFT_232303 [Aspergillus navahoensis]
MPCPAREEFQIGWICALPIEAAAAKEMLDEDFGILEEQDAADTNSYRLGRIGKHHIVIACLPGEQYGACAATTVANNMVRTFSKSLRIGLMVGVGGGIPSTDHDIRLGPDGPRQTLADPAHKTRRQRDGQAPLLHYGIIASGNSVIKHGCTREQLRLELGALCFEMEAAGLMLDFPCIVIRGICDYSDSHKNKQWQGYAAMAAAAYAKELLEYKRMWLTYHCIGSVENLTQEVRGTNQRLDIAYDQQERHHREQTARALTDQKRKCHQAFKISTYEQHKDINPGRVPGTCQWVLQNPQYRRWWNSCCNDLLWISADPGCGKPFWPNHLLTMTSKRWDKDEQNNLATALCAILHQLFSQQPNLLQHALPSWERNGNKLLEETGELWRIFIAATSDPTSVNTVCVLDALDECHPNDQRQLIRRLEDFYHRTDSSTVGAWLKFLITSRPYDEQRLEDQLLRMEHRTYIWLYLAIDDIRTTFKDSLWPADESIRLIPPSVDAAYGKILARVPSNQVNTVRKILQIIVGAQRPLTTQEMAMALGIALFPKSRSAAKAGIDPVRLARKIRQLCGLFVFINNSKIYLIHQTAREFLISRDFTSNPNSMYIFNQTDAESLIAQMDAIHLAAFNGHTRMVHKLLTGNENDADKADDTGSNALIWASLNGHKGVTELLLQQGANVNAQGGRYGNALCSCNTELIPTPMLDRMSMHCMLPHCKDMARLYGCYCNTELMPMPRVEGWQCIAGCLS